MGVMQTLMFAQLKWSCLHSLHHLFFCLNIHFSWLESPFLSFPALKCDEFTDLSFSHAFIGTSVNIRLLLFTRENGTCGTLMSHSNLSAHPQFNFSRPTTFVIHGYRPTGSPPQWLPDIIELLLARKDMNVIVVDWNKGATNVNYLKAVENTHKAADNLTAFLEMMAVRIQNSLGHPRPSLDRNREQSVLINDLCFQDQGVSLSSIHMIGVSLGAHISGFVGAKLNGSIGRITGKTCSLDFSKSSWKSEIKFQLQNEPPYNTLRKQFAAVVNKQTAKHRHPFTLDREWETYSIEVWGNSCCKLKRNTQILPLWLKLWVHELLIECWEIQNKDIYYTCT